MRTIMVILVLTLPLHVLSQGLIGKKKTYIKKWLYKEAAKQKDLKVVVEDRDSAIWYSYRGENYPVTDFIYYFDKSGKCYLEKVVAACDSCYSKYLNNLLGIRKYDWKKLNENQYVSKFNKYLMIELPTEHNIYSFQILKSKWTRKSYKMLMANN